VPKITPSRYLLLVETGTKCSIIGGPSSATPAQSRSSCEEGDHSLQSFPTHLARILSFAGY